MTFCQRFCLVSMLLIQGFNGLQWTSETQTQSVMQACAGDTITFPWFFTLKDREQLEVIRWLYAPPGSDAPVLMADMVSGTFMAVPLYAGRFSYLDKASVDLSQVTLGDSGNYTMVVSIHNGDAFSSIHHTVSVTVTVPSSSGESLTVMQADQAVYDSAGNLHVQLVCGQLTSRGQPPVDVIWTTPTGTEMASSNYENGSFHLLLDTPVKGGNYSCRLPPRSPSTLCLPGNDSLLEEAAVEVDAVNARLTLLEAKEQELREQNRNLTAENHRLKDDILTLQNSDGTSLMHVTFQAGLARNRNVNTTGPLKFNVVMLNEGGAYNPTTGEFTAPINGSYFFILTTSPYATGQSNDVHIVVDGSSIVRIHNSYHSHSNNNMATAHVAVCLAEGQKVWLMNAGDMYYSSALSHFTGFLLHPDC
ncbi:uncharacterized protein [Littorina saxatilis]|uniref:C1q domain-containing protein n=1 Tax=Littorina saxatilis TaxID=31220 RepID=A0AAN9GB43_9CAEN